MPERAHLIDLITGESLEFQYAPPELNDDKSTAYSEAKVFGWSHPRQQYNAGGARTLQFKLEFYGTNTMPRVRWLQSLLYPEYENGNIVNGPHRVKLVFGGQYEAETWTVTAVKAKAFDRFTRELIPMRAELDITLTEYVERSVDYREVRG